MKPIALVCAVSTALGLAATSTAAQTAYPLTCVFEAGQTVGISPSLTRPSTDLVVGFAFRPGNRPATAGVDPGTCAWQDRAFRPGEPTTIAQIVRAHWRYVMVTVGGQTVPVLAPTGSPWAPQAAVAGYRITFRVYASAPDAGIAVPFLRIAD
jgi:hypothetical protein